jgi:glycerol-3-phosphate O-acyltransferase/dihydroxyacetone phosphate acyltransferase
VFARENIPQFGPVIFTVNHANQFIDAIMVLCTCQHKVSYLMAENSWKRPIIGHFAWALGVVPVKRAQDDAKPGTGQVTMKRASTNVSEIVVKGTDSLFVKELAAGDKIRLAGTAAGFKVKGIENEKTLTLEGDDIPTDFLFPSDTPVAFDILKRIDTKVVFEKVLDKLADGGACGIFPEGGSHDRTDLLPLKVGVALVAYSALEKDGLSIPIVPVGLNYFKAYRWRGRAVVEYGQPIFVDPATLKDYKAGGSEVSRLAYCRYKYLLCSPLVSK